jgi:hypothetical protein
MQDLDKSGALPIPPGYTLHQKEFLDFKTNLGRIMLLDDLSDRKAIIEIAKRNPQFEQLVNEHLNDYLELLSEPHWRRLYDGPTVIVPAKAKHLWAFEFSYLLDMVRQFKIIKRFEGSASLISSLKNTPQIASTFFEIETAAFCATRTATNSLIFSPEVNREGRIKRPDYLWKTTLGDLYCECKLATDFEDLFSQRIGEISLFIDDIVKRNLPPTGTRYDFVVSRTAQAEVSINRLMDQLSQLRLGSDIKHNFVALALVPRDAPPPSIGSVIRVSNVPANSTDYVPLNPYGAASTVSYMSVSYWQQVSARLIRDARSQLPKDKPCAIMIGLPTENTALIANPKVESLIRSPEYRNTPWISIWAQGGVRLVFHNNQPFDIRLAEPIGISS